MHLRAVTQKLMTMLKKVIVAVAAIIVSALAVSAQTPGPKFERYNRWMVGGQLSYNTQNYPGIGVEAIYGRQFSEIVFLGVGFGTDMFVGNRGEMSMTITHPDGTETVMKYPPYEFTFLLPVYADLQVNFSRKRAPFFAELKFGGAIDVELERIRGTENTNSLDLWGGGVLFGAAIGKRFALRNESEIDVTLGWDGIIWPWYINAPVSVGVRYCF